MNTTIKCFTDASYSQHKNLAVVGYKIGEDKIVLKKLPYTKNTLAELIAINLCISACNIKYPGSNIIIFTDCQRALKNNYPKNVEIKKIKGHKKGSLKDENDLIFSTVDKKVRKAMRKSNPYPNKI